ncbi:AraC family transcriptional regulator [Pseudomonas oryzihabitans]|uniref:AraC family transcriptional regulator n=1 Tax=Pseudomonas oryzihabitans TaxID=47885 RepID=UPI00241D3DBA|nr:AraC family transcriptional regulator [Pseudomonas oryzihabitans]
MRSQIELPGATDWVRHAPAHAELESIEAFFSGHAFDPHRHATYAIGRTLAGVQSFSYRGARTNSLPGETMILHPDEVHDGRAGAADGFRYRMLYLPPTLVQDILGGRPLPFHRDGISQDPRLARATEAVFAALNAQPDVLARDDALYGLVATLAEVCQPWPSRGRVDFAAALRAREYLEDHLDQAVTLDDLARCAGRDRWSLTRDFRAYFGTSPHRYLTLRRLDQVRLQVRLGRGLAEAAVAAGFYDQSHMTKHFRQAFGMAPARWFRGLGTGPDKRRQTPS